MGETSTKTPTQRTTENPAERPTDRTKAEFWALRESVGMARSALANELGVQVRSVRRWESPGAPQRAPKDAWDVLDEAMAAQRRAVSDGLAKVDGIAAEQGCYPKAVSLPHWASGDDHDEFYSGPGLGDWRMANASMRVLALALLERGIQVKWVDGVEGADAPSERSPVG